MENLADSFDRKKENERTESEDLETAPLRNEEEIH